MAHLSDEALCDAVAALLVERGYSAEGQLTGGNIFCVSVDEPMLRNASWLWGMGGDTWGASLMYADSYEVYDTGHPFATDLWVDVDSECQNVSAIADAIVAKTREWRRQALAMREGE